jgi:capsule polysaccharide export protein KpsE/RkpR
MRESEEAWAKVVTAEPVTELQAEMESGAELRTQLQRELANAQLLAADADDRDNAQAKLRIPELQKQIKTIDARLAERERTLSQRSAHRGQLEAERKARQTELAAAETRLREARADAGYRGERMKLIDPGVVPQRPSSPNLLLNVLAALLLGLILPVVFLAIEMNYQEQRIAVRRGAVPAFRNSDE